MTHSRSPVEVEDLRRVLKDGVPGEVSVYFCTVERKNSGRSLPLSDDRSPLPSITLVFSLVVVKRHKITNLPSVPKVGVSSFP